LYECSGKIGVIIPELFYSLDLELVQGIHERASMLGYDVLIFTDTCNKDDQYRQFPNVISFSNIYQLAFHSDLDGILFVPSRFLSKQLRSSICDALRKLPIPCIAVGEQTTLLPCVTSPQEECIYMLTKHLIEVHHCRKLYCITGFQNDYHSDQRLSGFQKAMKEAGLSVEDSMIFYGGFWKEVPEQLGQDIAEGKVEKPDAVVCASDVMAVALCESLMRNGIKVPDEISVTGYDGNWDTAICSPQITTVYGREHQMGFIAMSRLYEMMTGRESKAEIPQQYIRYGTSCGCKPLLQDLDENTETYISCIIHQWFEKKVHMPVNISSIMSGAATLDELAGTILCYSYMITPIMAYTVCICDDWRFDFENITSFRKEGFSEKMLALLQFTLEEKAVAVPFSRRSILPELEKPHAPQLIVFTSLHQEAQIFGYVATKHENALQICVDEHFMNWCDAIANGLDSLQHKMQHAYVKQQFEALSIHDPSTGLYNKRGLMEQLPKYQGRSDCIYLLISYSGTNRSGAYLTRHTLIANALRLSSDGEELLSRLGDTVFAVIFCFDGQNMASAAEHRIALLEEKMREFQGGILNPQVPDLITEYTSLTFRKMSEAGAFIEEHLHMIQERTYAAENTAGDYHEKLHRLHREIYSSPQNEWTISNMAASMGMSSTHFQRIYKAEFGISCMEDVITARIEKAKWLLQHTELHVQEIADKCGYHHLNHFMRQFKKRIGITAMQYRKDTTAQYINGMEATVVWNPYATNKAYVELEFTPLGMGDINADGNFNVADVVALQKWLLCAKGAEKSIVEWKAGNFVDDDRLDAFDLSLMKRALLAQ